MLYCTSVLHSLQATALSCSIDRTLPFNLNSVSVFALFPLRAEAANVRPRGAGAAVAARSSIPYHFQWYPQHGARFRENDRPGIRCTRCMIGVRCVPKEPVTSTFFIFLAAATPRRDQRSRKQTGREKHTTVSCAMRCFPTLRVPQDSSLVLSNPPVTHKRSWRGVRVHVCVCRLNRFLVPQIRMVPTVTPNLTCFLPLSQKSASIFQLVCV